MVKKKCKIKAAAPSVHVKWLELHGWSCMAGHLPVENDA